jgi:hypothetical protein
MWYASWMRWEIPSLDITMNNFYVPNVTVVIFDRAICTRETGKEEGWILKIADSGSADSFDPLFKTETSVRTTRW